jgi:hypothetical protein
MDGGQAGIGEFSSHVDATHIADTLLPCSSKNISNAASHQQSSNDEGRST